jgi:hypothetical protein
MAKGKGGFIGQDGLNAPDSPTGASGSAGDEQVEVSFTAPSDVGAMLVDQLSQVIGCNLMMVLVRLVHHRLLR